MTFKSFCNGNDNEQLKMSVYDWDSATDSDFVSLEIALFGN